jgi:hypothetical protein
MWLLWAVCWRDSVDLCRDFIASDAVGASFFLALERALEKAGA